MMHRWIAIAGCVLSTTAFADQESVNETKDASADGFVYINVTRGDVRVEGWDRNQVKVEGVLDERTERFIFEVSGDDTRIEVRIPRSHNHWYNDGASDLVIHVPEGSHLDVSGVSTDVQLKEIQGAVEVGVVSGDVDLDGGSDRIELQTVSGEIEMRDASGRIRVNTVSGDIESYNSIGVSSYSSVSGSILVEEGGMELELETVSGDIDVGNEYFMTVTGHSVSGDIEVSGQLSDGGEIEFDNVSGSIRVNLENPKDVRFDVETGSGSIRNRITDDKPKVSKYVRDESLRFELGDGDSEVILSTRSGDVTLSKR